LKTNLQAAAIWFVENKDKSLDEILVERWKEKCSGTDSKKEKRKRCVSAALAEREDDTPEEKLVKDALKSLLEEDSDEVYEFLSRSSSRTFRDIENDGETHDLGAATDKDCPTQEGNRRNKRCATWKPTHPILTDTVAPVPDILHVAKTFKERHVMNDNAFEDLFNTEEITQHSINYQLNLFRPIGGKVPANTIIKRSDAEKLTDYKNSDPYGWNLKKSKKKIQIIQVELKKTEAGELKPTAKWYKAKVVFGTKGGEINHMEPPEEKTFIPRPPPATPAPAAAPAAAAAAAAAA
jgi:hypothetical protein